MTTKKKHSRKRGKYLGLYRRKFERRIVRLDLRMMDEELQIWSEGTSRMDLTKIGDICKEERFCEEFRVENMTLVLLKPDYAAFSEKDTEILMQDAFEELNCDVEFMKEMNE